MKGEEGKESEEGNKTKKKREGKTAEKVNQIFVDAFCICGSKLSSL